MKLPDSGYKTGVQSLGREDSRYAARAHLARGAAVAKLIDIPVNQIEEAQKKFKAENDAQNLHSANMYMVDAQTTFDEKVAGKMEMPSTDVPEYIDVPVRMKSVRNEDGGFSKIPVQVPLYKFRHEMWHHDIGDSLQKASLLIEDPELRADWLRKQSLKLEQGYGKMLVESLEEQTQYGRLKAEAAQDRFVKQGQYGAAISVVDNRTDLTEEEKELERTKLYQGQELHQIGDVLTAGSPEEIQSEITRLEIPHDERDSVLTQDQALTALSALYARYSRLTNKNNAALKTEQNYWKGHAKGYMDYLTRGKGIDLNNGARLKSQLTRLGLTEELEDIRYAEINANMFNEIRRTNREGAQAQFDVWMEAAERSGDYRMQGFLQTRVKPVLEDHLDGLYKDPRQNLTENGVIDHYELDYSNPIRFVDALSKRWDQEETIEFVSGEHSKGMLTREEAINFGSFYNTADKATQKKFASAIATMGREKAINFFNQMYDAGVPASAYGVGVAMLRGRPDVADDILEGGALLKQKGLSQQIFGEHRRAVSARLRTAVGDFFSADQTEALGQFLRNAEQMYAARALREGEAGISGKLIDEVVDDLVGERFKWHGQTLNVPPGVSEKSFKSYLKTFGLEDLERMGEVQGYSVGQFMSQVKRGVLKLVPYGVNQYAVLDPRVDQYVWGKDGKKFLFKHYGD